MSFLLLSSFLVQAHQSCSNHVPEVGMGDLHSLSLPKTSPIQQAFGKDRKDKENPQRTGSLRNGIQLERSGPGYRFVNDSKYAWGTTELVTLLEYVAATTMVSMGKTMLIGDLSARNGGAIYKEDKVKPVHGTHYNGLGSDITMVAKTETGNPDERFVNTDGSISSNLDLQGTYTMIKDLVLDGEEFGTPVKFFYVNFEFKLALCRAIPDSAIKRKVMLMLRADKKGNNNYHFNHVHMQIECPKARKPGTPRCENGPAQRLSCAQEFKR